MSDQQSKIIELLRTGPKLAADLKEITPYYCRCVTKLRKQGYTIECKRNGKFGGLYTLLDTESAES